MASDQPSTMCDFQKGSHCVAVEMEVKGGGGCAATVVSFKNARDVAGHNGPGRTAEHTNGQARSTDLKSDKQGASHLLGVDFAGLGDAVSDLTLEGLRGCERGSSGEGRARGVVTMGRVTDGWYGVR